MLDRSSTAGPWLACGAVLSLLVAAPLAAQTTLADRPAALLVFPEAIARGGDGSVLVETLLTVSSLSDAAVGLHFALVDGSSCAACDLDTDLPPRGSITFRLRREVESLGVAAGDATTVIDAVDGSLSPVVCPGGDGFVVVNLQDDGGTTRYENVLVGETTTVDHRDGTLASARAIAFQASESGGDGSRAFRFDGETYGRLPRRLRVDPATPDDPDGDGPRIDASLSLLTLGFIDGDPPFFACELTGADADGEPIDAELEVNGCWTRVDLSTIPGVARDPVLGPELRGLTVECRVGADPKGELEPGGVHGVLSQHADAGAVQLALPLVGAGRWSRLATGDPAPSAGVTLDLGGAIARDPDPAPGPASADDPLPRPTRRDRREVSR